MKQQKRNSEDMEYENQHHITRKRKHDAHSNVAKTPRQVREMLQADMDEDDDNLQEYARYIK